MFNTKIKEVKNKMKVTTDLVLKNDYGAKILEIKGKYCTTSDYSDILDAKIKQK